MNKTKILHLTTHLNIGGITTYIYLLGKGLDSAHYETSVFSSGGEMEKQFNKSGIRTYASPFRTKSELSPKLYFAIPEVIRIIKNENINLLHAHTRVTQVMAWWIQKITGIPYVSTCHGFYKRRLGRRLLPAWGNKVIAISPPVADSLVNEFKVPAEKVKTILNAIDIDTLEDLVRQKNQSSITIEYDLQSTKPILGIVARIVKDKGHEYLLKAFAQLLPQYPDLKLLVVGTGSYLSDVKKLADQLSLTKNLTFVGNLNDVTKALAVIDIFILPAVWREGFGLSIVEAMALKKPVIATNIWALNSLVQNKVNGLLIQPKNVTELASAITELIENQDLRRAVGEKAYKTVQEQFSIKRMTRDFDRLYQQILQSDSRLAGKKSSAMAR